MNNYNFTQSLDGLNNIEADTINTSVLNVNSLIVNTAQITTLSNSNLVNCTSNTPVNNNSIVNKTYVDTNFVDLINQQVISGNKIFNDTITVLNNITYQDILATIPVKELQTYLTGNILTYFPLFNLNIYNFITKNSSGVQKDALKITNADMTTNCNFISNQQATFNNFAPISNTEPTLSAHLITKNYAQSTFQTIANMVNYVDITTNQTIGGDKTFTGTVFLNDDIRFQDIITPYTKQQQIFQEGSVFTFYPLFNLNSYRFVTKSSLGTQKDALEITNADITTNSNFISNQQATFNNSNTFGTLTSDVQTVNSWLYLKHRTLVYDVSFPNTAYSQIYMIGNLDLVFGVNPNNGTIQLYSKTSVGSDVNMFSFTPTLNTSRVPLTCLQQATFNTVAPLCSIAPSSGDSLCNRTYVDSVGASSILASNNTFTGTNTFSNDITLSKIKNNSTYATYNGLSGSYIGYVSESVAATYLATLTNTQYQVGAVSLTSANVGFYSLNWEVELNSAGMASTVTKIYAFISDNNVSTTIPVNYPGAKANNFSTQTYTAGDSTYHSGSFTFLQPATSNIYALQLKIIYATGAIERKGVVRITRIL